MSQTIEIKIRNKIAQTDFNDVVSLNDVYFLKFDFDEEWEEFSNRLAVVFWEGGAAERLFTGDTVEMPQIRSIFSEHVHVGVYSIAENRRISSSLVPIRCLPGTLSAPKCPKNIDSLHDQILDRLNKAALDPCPGALTVGDKSYDGTKDVEITAEDLSLSDVALSGSFNDLKDVPKFAYLTDISDRALLPNDVTVYTEALSYKVEKQRKQKIQSFGGVKKGESKTIEILIESENELEIASDLKNALSVSFTTGGSELGPGTPHVFEGNYSGGDGEVSFEKSEYRKGGKCYLKVKITIVWNEDINDGGLNNAVLSYDEIVTTPLPAARTSFPIKKGSKITFHGFDSELIDDDHLSIEGTRLKAEGYTTFTSGDITLIGKNIGIAQEGNKLIFEGTGGGDLIKSYVSLDTKQTITGEKTFSQQITVGDYDTAAIVIDTNGIQVCSDGTCAALKFPKKFGTVALEADVEMAKSAAEKAQETADTAVLAAATAQSSADSAKKAADGAKSAADNAKLAADLAQSTADAGILASSEAQKTADSAKTAAENAAKSADIANTAAQGAQETADTAVLAAQAAQSTADGAKSAAQAAQMSAGLAQSTADAGILASSEAQKTADSAKTAAENAAKSADIANTAAQGAQETADAAVLAAQTAQSTADGAKSAAQAAQMSAGLAQSTAETAQTAAETAQTAAQAAQSTASAAKGKADTALQPNDITLIAEKDTGDIRFPLQKGAKIFLHGFSADLLEEKNLSIDSTRLKVASPELSNDYIAGDITLIGRGAVQIAQMGSEISIGADFPTNYVTTDTEQKIEGNKTFAGTTTFGDYKTRGVGITSHGFGVYVNGDAYSVNFQERSGTLALDEDIPLWARTESKPTYTWGEITGENNFVTMDTSQLISGFKVFKDRINIDYDLRKTIALEAETFSIGVSQDGEMRYLTLPYSNGTVALEEKTLLESDVSIHASNAEGQSLNVKLQKGTVLEFNGFDFDEQKSSGHDTITFKGTRIKASGSPEGFLSGDITLIGKGITIAQSGRDITLTKVAPTWSEVTSKPSWIGSSKPSYSWSDITSKPTNFVTTDGTQTISGAKTFTGTGGVIVRGSSSYPYFRVGSDGLGYAPSSSSEYMYKFPQDGGTVALTKNIPTDKEIGLKAHPVGSYYISNSSTSPATLFGGSWTAVTGRFLYCNAGTGTGGSNTHTLTINEMPSHQHGTAGLNTEYYGNITDDSGFSAGGIRRVSENVDLRPTKATGGGQSFSTMPAYQTVYAWRRTA